MRAERSRPRPPGGRVEECRETGAPGRDTGPKGRRAWSQGPERGGADPRRGRPRGTPAAEKEKRWVECPLRAGSGSREWRVWRRGEPSKVNAGLGRPVLSELPRHPQSLNCPRQHPPARQVRAGPRVSPLLSSLITHVSARGAPSPEGQGFEPRPQAAMDGRTDGQTDARRAAAPAARACTSRCPTPSTEQGPSSGAPGPRGQAAVLPGPPPASGPGEGSVSLALKVAGGRGADPAWPGGSGSGSKPPLPEVAACRPQPAARRPLPTEAVPLPPGRPSARPPPAGLSASVLPPSSPPDPHAPSKADLRPVSPQCSLDTVITKTVRGWTCTPALSAPPAPSTLRPPHPSMHNAGAEQPI